jgi:hypothetical protein
MMLHQEHLDYTKHCIYPFGSYVQAYTEPNIKNSMLPRTLDCIYLRYVNNQQGGHNLLDIRTGKVITRRTITMIPITQHVIDVVHNMASAEGFTAGLKIEARGGLTLYDSSQLAGVDIPDDQNDNEANHIGDVNDDMDAMHLNEIADIFPDQVQARDDAHDDIQQVDDNVMEDDAANEDEAATREDDNGGDEVEEGFDDPE